MRNVIVVLAAIFLLAALWASRLDFYIASGSDSAVNIYRHSLWSQALAYSLCIAGIALGLLWRRKSVLIRIMIPLVGLGAFTASLHVLSFSYQGEHVFREHYGPIKTQSLRLNQAAETPLLHAEGLFSIRIWNDQGGKATVLRWPAPWRHSSHTLIGDRHVESPRIFE